MYSSPFLESIRYILRSKHYSIQTEKAYLLWIKRFIIFNQKRHPRNMGEEEVSNYLTYLAVDRKVTSSTKNLALCSIVFMYKHVFKKELTLLSNTVRAKDRMTLLPQVLIEPLKAQINKVEDIHRKDLAEGEGKTSLPSGLSRKYPKAITEFKWQYLFPSTVRCQHPTDGYFCRHHLHWSSLSKALKTAVVKTDIRKHVTAHTFGTLSRLSYY